MQVLTAGHLRLKAASAAETGLPARALHLFVLWGFAAVQPLLDLLGRNAQFFVAQGSRPVEIVAMVLVLCLLCPVLLVLVELVAGLAAPWIGRSIHRSLVALLAAATILPLVKRLAGGLPGALQIAAVLAFGVAAAWGYQRFAAIRTYLSILAPAPPVFAALFLLCSPASELVLPGPRIAPPAAIDAGRPGAQRHPVVLVIFDELSLPTLMDETRRIDALRYPAFAALEGAAHWFRNATTTAGNTVLALPALLTGRYLGEGHDEVPLATAASYPKNLFTLLGGSGYRLNVLERVTDLCPSEMCAATELGRSSPRRMRNLLSDLAAVYLQRLVPVDLAAGLPPVDRQWAHFGFLTGDGESRGASGPGAGSGKAGAFSVFQAAIRAESGGHDGAGSLHFLHSGLPHVPWRYLPSGRHYCAAGGRLTGKGPGIRKGLWVKDRWPVLQAFQRYLLQQQFTDRLLGEVLRALEESGLYDQALVIVTADHGVSFRPGSPRRHLDRRNFADIMSVPLFVKLPGQREGVLSDRNVELIDVLATVVDVLGLEPPWPMDGSSVFDPAAPERPEKRFFHGRRQRVLSFEPAAMDARYQTVERMVEAFGPSSDPLAIYRIGPFPDFVGRPLSELEIEPEPRHRVRLKMPEIYHQVDPASGFVPARVIGHVRLQEPAPGPLKLAIAVGGAVWATTYTLKTKTSRAPFTALVPERAFVAGRNPVEVFVISGPPEHPRLQRPAGGLL